MSPLLFSPRSQCDGKRRFASKREARNANRMAAAHGGDRLKAYRCLHCGCFHLGHNVRGAYQTNDPSTEENP